MMKIFSANKQGRSPELATLILSGIAIVVGIVAGFGAIAFRYLIALFHNLFLLGEFNFHYDSTVHTLASPWGTGIILVPVIGSVIVTYLVKNFAPEVRGTGVPEVMEAIYYKKGYIRPLVVVAKSFASAISIGSGGSVGREGPIIQIGSAFGSTMGQIINMRTWQRITLIAAGAGGGIAATFNTPIGGILFAIEIMLQEVSVRTLVPVSMATVSATYIGRTFLGDSPAFKVPGLKIGYTSITSPETLVLFVGLGLLMGAISALYIKSVYSFEDFFFKKLNVSDYIRHAAGMLAMGLMMFLMMRITGRYYIQGVGYATIQDVLSGNLDLAGFLLLLAGLKLLSVCFTLGSGASGGIFSPGLYIGATIGGAFAIIFQHLFPGLSISVVAFVLAGMAGVIAGTTGAAMASIVIIFEMTLDYNIIIPVTLTVALSYVIRKILVDKSMFTMQVSRHGRYMPEALQANYHHEIFAKDIVDDQYREIPGHLSLEDFSEILTKNRDTPWFIRTNEQNRIDGVVSRDRALIWTSEYDQTTLVKDLPFYSFEKVSPHSKLFQVTKLIGRCSSHLVLVIKDTMDKSSKSKSEIENVVGIITRTNVARVMERAMNMFSE